MASRVCDADAGVEAGADVVGTGLRAKFSSSAVENANLIEEDEASKTGVSKLRRSRLLRSLTRMEDGAADMVELEMAIGRDVERGKMGRRLSVGRTNGGSEAHGSSSRARQFWVRAVSTVFAWEGLAA